MRFPRPRTPRWLFLPAVLLLLAAALVTDDDTAPWPRTGDRVGPARCIECHDVAADLIAEGFHAAVVHSPAAVGCETCHGPGAAHAGDEALESITYPPLLAPEVQVRLCGQCHAAEARDHAGGGVETFLEAGLGCTECHPVHEKRPDAAPFPGVRFLSKAATLVGSDGVDDTTCVRCHPRQDRLLREPSVCGGGHADHAAGSLHDERPPGHGCVTCHGHGARHVESGGLARLVSRPDRARDGVATCRACHADVDPETFHWPADHPALRGGQADCFTCHRIHVPPPAEIDSEVPTNRTCVACHGPDYHGLADSVHAELGRLDTPLSEGCAGCHDGALEHARSGGRAALVASLRGPDPGQLRAACMSCHQDHEALRGVATDRHARRDLSCLDCHESPAIPRGRVRERAEARCAACHADVAARFRLPNHHPTAEQGGGCTDCHDPHDIRTTRLDRRLREQDCTDCHRAYRGPFVFPHRVQMRGGCTTCHDPHGSPNRRLLHQVTTQQNCIACHGDFPSFHDQTQGSVFTNCLNCHTRIHGSNHSRYLFR